MFSRNGSRRLSEIFRGFRSVKLFGAEFVLNEESARQVKQSAHEAFHTYRSQAKVEYDRLAGVYGLREKLEQVVPSLRLANGQKLTDIKKLRCTIHVPDVVFAETMYQLVDYYGMPGGRGRTWSFRYGILGKAWRLGKSQTQGSVPTDKDQLIHEWGMTREEAATAGQDRQSFSCVILRDDDNTPVGVFYMDAPTTDAFDASSPRELKQFHENVLTACKKNGLTAGLANLRRELLALSPLINIYG